MHQLHKNGYRADGTAQTSFESKLAAPAAGTNCRCVSSESDCKTGDDRTFAAPIFLVA